jgi:hypothetical protein
MIRKYLLSTIVLLCITASAGFSHALWIETAARGQKGIAQEVKVYFGEYTTHDISPAGTWLSDLSEFSLLLVTPDNKEIPLQTNPADDHYTATFTPREEGVYRLIIHKVAKELYYGYRLDYNASAGVQVGAEPVTPKHLHKISIAPEIKDYRVNDTIHFETFVDAALAGDKTVEVIAPNTWVKKIYPDDIGKASFVPRWPGKYIVEMIVQSATKGDHNGAEFTTDFHCATYMIEVK